MNMMIMNRSLADKRKKQVTRGKNLPGTQTPNSFSSHRISWEKKSESCFRHLLKVQLITSYWSGFTSKFHPSREVKKKLHLGRNLLWFFAREQFCHFWRERKRVTREGDTEDEASEWKGSSWLWISWGGGAGNGSFYTFESERGRRRWPDGLIRETAKRSACEYHFCQSHNLLSELFLSEEYLE